MTFEIGKIPLRRRLLIETVTKNIFVVSKKIEFQQQGKPELSLWQCLNMNFTESDVPTESFPAENKKKLQLPNR